MMDEIVYICDRCGEGFSQDEADRWFDDGEWLTACPNCGSCDHEEAKRCKVCREIVPEYEIRGGVCKGCFEDAVSAYKAALNSLTWEREVLDDEYGNIDITEE